MRVFVIAGEPSGDRLGGALMQGLKKLHPDILFDGVGGPEMQAQGLKSRFDMSELSIMGLIEILPRYRALKRRIRETADRVIKDEPDVLISIDSPEFCFRVAKRVKAKSDVPTVHYVAPTVWAWRPQRAARIAQYIDHLLALFPFEPAYFSPHGMRCDFVGHPVVAEPVASERDALSFRAAHGIADAPLLLVLPGSRAAEVKRLKDVFGKAVKRFVDVHADARVVVPAAASVADMVLEAVKSWPVQPMVLDPRANAKERAQHEKRAAFRAADVALAASGSVSLELAASRTPMVMAYRMNPLTYAVMERMVRVDTVTLVNLVSDTRVVPEFLGPSCKADAIGRALLAAMEKPDAQLDAMDATMSRLGAGQDPPGERAARSVLSFLATRNQ